MNKIEIVPIGFVENNTTETGLPGFREMDSKILLADHLPENAFIDLEFFSHLEIIFYFDLHGNPQKSNEAEINKSESNTFVRKNYGPGLFGTSIVKLIKKEGKNIFVKGLDALNGTQVIDIKPVMSEFLPKEEVLQPDWSKKISGKY